MYKVAAYIEDNFKCEEVNCNEDSYTLAGLKVLHNHDENEQEYYIDNVEVSEAEFKQQAEIAILKLNDAKQYMALARGAKGKYSRLLALKNARTFLSSLDAPEYSEHLDKLNKLIEMFDVVNQRMTPHLRTYLNTVLN